ncbi:hypothetical protein NO2_1685, partial [Candidatus Termititenax persephonae]
VVRGGRAKLKNLVWGTADGEIKTADLTPTSTITVAVLLAGGNTEALEDFENDYTTRVVTEIQDAINDYYASKPAELEDLIDVVENGGSLTGIIESIDDEVIQDYLPRLVPTLTGSPVIDGLADEGNIGFYDFPTENRVTDYSSGTPGIAELESIKIGQRDGFLVFQIKPLGSFDTASRYAARIWNNGWMINLNLEYNTGSGQWQTGFIVNDHNDGANGGYFLEINSRVDYAMNDIIEISIPLEVVQEYIISAYHIGFNIYDARINEPYYVASVGWWRF